MLATAALPEAGILTGHVGGVFSVVFSPDGKTLASGSDTGTVRLWDVATGRTSDVLNGHTSRVTSVVFSPDGEAALADRAAATWL